MTYTTSKSTHLSNRDFFVRSNSYDSSTIPSNEVKITDSTGVAGAFFGYSVAVGSGRIVVGAWGETDSGLGIGSVSIFDLNGNFISKINGDGPASDFFGKSVAVGSGRIVVGAPSDDIGGFTNSGSAFIFDLQGNLLTKITPSDPFNDSKFGEAAAIGDGKILISAVDLLFGSNIGAAYIFDLDGNQLAKITPSDGANSDFFGRSVAVGSGRIVVGASGNDSNGSGAGAAYIFDLDGNLITRIVSNDIAAGDAFGYSVAVGSGRIVVGAVGDDDNESSSGVVFIFDLDGNQINKITASDAAANETFGRAVAIGSGRIVTGSELSDTVNGTDSGSAYIFDLEGNELVKIVPNGVIAGDSFGASVAIDSGKIVIGADGADDNGSNSGAAYIYDTPDQKHFLDQLD